MWLVMEVKFNAVKSNTACEPEMLGLWIKVNWKRSNRRWQEWTLGISKLKWTGMGELNSDGHYIYYCGQEYLRRNGVAIIVNKRVQNAVIVKSLGCVWLFATPWTVAFQDPPSMGFSRQECWSGVLLPSPWNAILGCNLINDRMISVHFQGKPFNSTVIQSMPRPVMLKKLKLNSSMKTYKIF